MYGANESFNELYDFIVRLKLIASDGKNYITDIVNTEGLKTRIEIKNLIM
jgi:hypothetical protein